MKTDQTTDSAQAILGVVNEPRYLKNLFFSLGSKSIGLMGLILVLAPSVFTFFKAEKNEIYTLVHIKVKLRPCSSNEIPNPESQHLLFV